METFVLPPSFCAVAMLQFLCAVSAIVARVSAGSRWQTGGQCFFFVCWLFAGFATLAAFTCCICCGFACGAGFAVMSLIAICDFGDAHRLTV